MSDTLTPQQERFVTLLISGKTISDIAIELEVSRPTLYEWQRLETFQARYNQLTSEIKSTVESGLIGMYSEAIETVRSCLKSDNDQVKLKTALWLIDRAGDLSPGETDPEQIVRDRFTKTVNPFELEGFESTEELDQAGYTNRLKELGLKAS
jgi:hypothetical protein